jgi:hypothetical protein
MVVKNITFSADERLIEEARQVARTRRETLNDAFREWLTQYAGRADAAREFRELIKELARPRGGRRFTREERNAR